jgi:hypothetical protein
MASEWRYLISKMRNLPLSHVKSIVIYRRNSVLRVHLKTRQTLVKFVSQESRARFCTLHWPAEMEDKYIFVIILRGSEVTNFETSGLSKETLYFLQTQRYIHCNRIPGDIRFAYRPWVALAGALWLPHSKPHGATRQQTIAKTPAKWSAYQITSVIVVFVILVFKV